LKTAYIQRLSYIAVFSSLQEVKNSSVWHSLGKFIIAILINHKLTAPYASLPFVICVDKGVAFAQLN